jgi:hypothetical protein
MTRMIVFWDRISADQFKAVAPAAKALGVSSEDSLVKLPAVAA